MIHEKVFVKVNAQVDLGVAPLVEAISALPEFITAESCECDAGNEAYVSFIVRDGWEHLAEHVHTLSTDLGKNPALSDLWFTLSVEWSAGGESPLGYLRVPCQHIAAIAKAILSLAKERHHDLLP